VVARDLAKGDDAEIDGTELAKRLAASEKAHIEAAESLKQRQKTRALATKKGTLDFVQDVAYEPFASGLHTHKAEQQAVAQYVSETQVLERCYERSEAGASKVGGALRALGIELSPILEVSSLRKDRPKAIFRRAFAVGAVGSTSIAVMTIVEAWTVAYKGRSVYTHDGSRISAKGDATDGPLLFGRYLCDDSLSIKEEIRIVEHLYRLYGKKNEKELQELATCLADSNFLQRSTLLLRQLRSTSIATIRENYRQDAPKAIAAAVGPSPRLRAALWPGPVVRTNFGQYI
jgi:hypothetical protein